MNRNRYLQAYKDGLSIFEESYSQEKVLELDARITKLIETGKSEEEALSNLGEVDKLIEKVYFDNHVRLTKTSKKDNYKLC